MRFSLFLGMLSCSLVGVALRAQSDYSTPYTFTTLTGVAGAPPGIADGAPGIGKFNTPEAIVIDGAGNFYVADTANSSIRKVTPAGVISTFAGVTGSSGSSNGTGSLGRFKGPAGIAIDSAGNLYVSDTSNNTIRKITPAAVVTTPVGTVSTSGGNTNGNGAAATFRNPNGIVIDGAGNLFVADTQNQVIRKITPALDVTTFAGTMGVQGTTNGSSTVALFNYPTGLAIDGAGNLFVTEIGTHTIRKITPGGVVSTVAGTAGQHGNTDGTGLAAQFYVPYGIAVDGSGNLYVADTGNEVVRKITQAGVVMTLAGGAAGGVVNGTGAAAGFNSPWGITLDAAGVVYITEAGGNVIRVGVGPSSAPTIAGKVPGITVPVVVPAGPTKVEARAVAEQPGLGVIVAISGSYAVRPGSGGAQALTLPSYTNPQPYNLSYVVRLLANGQPDPAFTSAPGGDGTVNTVVVQADGKILVGGTFTTFNGVLFRNLARLNADGKSDATFALGSGVDAQVNAIAVQADGKILIGGLFQNYQGTARPWLLRLSDTGVVDTTFAPALNGAVDTIVVQADGKILIGGNFTSAGGAARTRLARLLATGANDASFDPGAGANDEVVTLRLQSNGAVIAGGDFTSFAGQSRGRIARVLSTGALDPAFLATATANGTIISLGLEAGGNVVLGGAFTSVNGVTRNRLARLLPDGTLDTTFDPGAGANNDVRSVLTRDDGTIFLGGLFDQYQSTAVNEVVAVTGSTVTTVFLQTPLAITVNVGGTARFVASATGTALSYQWLKDGVAISGATSATLTLSGVTASAAGRYTVQVTSGTGAVTSRDATLTVVGSGASQIINLSVLTSLDTTDATFTLGFVIGGAGTSGAKPLLVRAAGPALATFGVSNPLPDPKLQFYAGSTLAGQNDDWKGDPVLSALMTQVGAFAYTVPTSKDAAFAATANLSVPSNSVVVSSGSGTGAVIAEVYDATPIASVTATTPRLINVSVLKPIPAGATLTAGFVITGSVSKTVLVRAIGPTLATFGVGGPMSDPQLVLFAGSTQIASNDNWNGTAALANAMTSVGAFALNASSKDAALLITLPPGSYTAQASGVGTSAGAALVEVYEVP